MNSNNSSPWNVVWLILWAIVAIGLLGSISHSNNHMRGYTLAKQNAEVRELKKRHAEELSLEEQDLRAKSREAAARRERELDHALGGPVQAAFKNPGYSLRQALHRAALACAPTNADVRIDVDRFTEFTVTYSSDQPIATNQMIAIARQLLPVAQKYIDTLRFSAKGAIVAELDRLDIEYTDDWNGAPNDRIASLLAREIPAIETAQNRNALEQLKQERDFSQAIQSDPSLSPKASKAEDEFQAHAREAINELNAALRLAEKSTDLTGVTKLSDIDLRQKDLTQAATHAKKSKSFWTDPAKDWRESLERQGIIGDPLEKLSKNLAPILRHDPTKTAKLFEALEGRIESSRYFLKLAADQFGNWQFNSEFGQFGFTTEEVSRRFNRTRDQLIADSQTLESALRTWNESLSP